MMRWCLGLACLLWSGCAAPSRREMEACLRSLSWHRVSGDGRPPRGVVAHHKTGSVVAMTAHRVAYDFVAEACGGGFGEAPKSWLSGPLPAAFANETYVGWAASGPPARVAHLLRSPSDWVRGDVLIRFRSGDGRS